MKKKNFDNILRTNNIDDCAQLLELVLDGITDIIGIYHPDHTLVMYNKAGYEYFKKTHDEIVGKKCFEILGREKSCAVCTAEQVLKDKKLVRLEKYFPEMDLYMECTANPIFDHDNNIVLIVEQLRDITGQISMTNELRSREEKYRNLVELAPDAIIVIFQGKIAMANEKAVKLSTLSREELIGMSIANFIEEKDKERIKERLLRVLKEKAIIVNDEFKLMLPTGNSLNIEITSTYFDYNGKPATQSVIRNVTERKKEMQIAARIQTKRLEKEFPIEEKAHLEVIYEPAQTLSGDFYHFHKASEDLVVGLLGDVSGKGIAASLSASAIKVLFHESVIKSSTPLDMLRNINKEISRYLGDEFIAACCFTLDFSKNICTIAGAGINEFLIDNGVTYSKVHIKGAFLGMFENGMFQQKTAPFKKGDRFFFYTDGLQESIDQYMIEIKFLSNPNIKNTLENIKNGVDQKSIHKDDCTLLAIEILDGGSER